MRHTVLSRYVIAAVTAIGSLSGAVTLGMVSTSPATAATGGDGMPSQRSTDLASNDPSNTNGQAGWGDLTGGVDSRPYVTSLTVINGDTSTPIVVNGTTSDVQPPSGAITTIVTPTNLCKSGQAPAQGVCYATPNRVSLTVGYSAGDFDGHDFANPSVTVSPAITSSSIIDMTVALNTLGKSLRWTWINGDLLYWQPTNLGQDNATIHVRFHPALTPSVRDFPAGNGCTATPIFNCEIPTADADPLLTASMVLSLDGTLDPALTGAVFATQNAIAGFLEPTGTPTAPALNMQIASTHTTSTGSPQLGTLEAFIPAAALQNLYGILPGDATAAFATTRGGDAGANDPPTYAAWTAASNGADGLFVSIGNITFSTPAYKVASTLRHVQTLAKRKAGWTTVTAKVSGCSKKARCLATVYNLGRARSARYLASAKVVLRNSSQSTPAFLLRAPASRLLSGDRYLLVVRSARHKLLVSAQGTVR